VLHELCGIEARASFRPWKRDVFAEELTREGGNVVYARGEDGRIAAFIVYWHAVDEVQILNVATDPSARRRGHADRLLAHAIAFAREVHAQRLLLEVRKSNEPAIRLYRKHGLRPIGIRANYYAEAHEDALVMALSL
jgi:ribosomal-protein-alanine N-acetyltransferase